MLSFGIQFGKGFDQTTVIKVMQSIPVDYDYDLVVIGSNPGGVACAREARLANKKTALITWKSYSPAEAEGYDEDLRDVEQALGMSQGDISLSEGSSKTSASELKSSLKKPQSEILRFGRFPRRSRQSYRKIVSSGRKVRKSRLDLKNELFKRGPQCRRLMHNATILGRLVEDAQKSGWRLASASSTPITMNWHKLTEEIMDYVMQKNSELVTMLNDVQVEVIEATAVLQDSHTIKLIKPDKSEIEISSAYICLALPSECILPREVVGAMEYGITCDDFIRLELPPGNTLIVGALPESLECAGILSGCLFPVTVVSRSKILKGYDSEISQMIINNLKEKGVKFMEETTLVSVEMTDKGKLLARFTRSQLSPDLSGPNFSDPSKREGTKLSQAFDTVVFAVGRKVHSNIFDPGFGVEREDDSLKLVVNEMDATSVPNIYAVGEGLANRPDGFGISELAGKLLGKRLFHNESGVMDYAITPNVILTPIEYAFVGISEDAAIKRLGIGCVDVYCGNFRPLDFVIPPIKGSCYAKVIVLKLNDSIIGIHMFGPDAGEIIQGFAAAFKSGLTMSKFRTVVGVTATKAKEILNLQLKTYEDTQDLGIDPGE